MTNETVIALAARATHEVNRAYCAAIGDHSQVPWHEAPAWQRDSVLMGVRGVLGGTLATPEQQHEAWLQIKVADGWTWGAVKDPVAKTHPALLPYDQLPLEQKIKDFLFRAVCNEVAYTANTLGSE